MKNTDIVIDTGANSHILSQRDLSTTIKETEMNKVKLPDKSTVSSNRRGTVVIIDEVGRRQTTNDNGGKRFVPARNRPKLPVSSGYRKERIQREFRQQRL